MDIYRMREEWFPPRAAADDWRAQRHRIADLVRESIDELLGADVGAADAADLAGAEQLATALRDRLALLPDRRRSAAWQPLPDGALVERSPVSGRSNPIAPPLHYSFEGDVTHAWTEFGIAYEGPPGGVPGGVVAAAFDEVLGVAQMVSGAAGFTGRLEVRYHRITPIRTRVDYRAEVAGRTGRKLTVLARSTAGGELVAEAEGLFITQVDLRP